MAIKFQPFIRRVFWRPLPVVALICAALMLIASFFLRHCLFELHREQEGIRRDLQFRIAATANVSTAVGDTDFTQSLPINMPVDSIVETLQKSTQAFNTTLLDVTGEHQTRTTQTLERLVVDISLRGAYPAIKSTIGDMLLRYPNAVIQKFNIKREASPAGPEDAEIQFLLPLRSINNEM